MSGKYSLNLLDHYKKSATDALKTSFKRVIQKPQKLLVIWLVIKLLIVINEHDKEIRKEIYLLQKEDKKLVIN